MNNKYTCICCGFNSLNKWFNSQEICHICMWQNDDVSNLFPLKDWWPNDDLCTEQQKIMKIYPFSINEIDFYDNFKKETVKVERSLKWKPIDVKNIRNCKKSERPMIHRAKPMGRSQLIRCSKKANYSSQICLILNWHRRHQY